MVATCNVFRMENLFHNQVITMNSIPSSQTVLVIHNKLTIPMLLAVVKNSNDLDSLDFLLIMGSVD